MKKFVGTALAVACVVASSVTGSAGTEAAPPVRIIKVFFDSPGSPDSMSSNTSLNGEYIAVKNVLTRVVNLKGWRVSDVQGHVFVFPSVNVPAGGIAIVHTGNGTVSGTHLFWKAGNFVWNNDKDTATLRNPAGTVIHQCKYPNSAGGVKIVGTTATGKFATCP